MRLRAVMSVVLLVWFHSTLLDAEQSCREQEKKIVHRFYPLRHCQRSNRTVIALASVRSVRECANLARHKQALAFNYAPEGRNRSNLFEVARQRKKNSSRPAPWQPKPVAPSTSLDDQDIEEYYNCHVLDCPEHRNLSTVVNDTRFDYYSLYAGNLPLANATCVPSIGVFLFQETKLNYSSAYNACVTLGGSLAHVATDARTFNLAKYIANLPASNELTTATPEQTTPTTVADEPMFFVGLNESTIDSFFTSAGERLLDCFTFRAWAPGHPDRRRRKPGCVALTGEGSWKVISCNRTLPYICELHTSGPALFPPDLGKKCSVKRPNNRFAPSRRVIAPQDER